MGRIHSEHPSSADKNLQLNQQEAERLLTEHIAALELEVISKNLSTISNPVLHFLLKREIIKRRPLDDLKGKTTQNLGLAASQWDVLKSDSTAYLYGRAMQEAENMGLDCADPEARMAIIEQSSIQHKLKAIEGRMDVVGKGSRLYKKLNFDFYKTAWKEDPTPMNGYDYVISAMNTGEGDVDEIVEEVSMKGLEHKSFALSGVLNNTSEADKPARAKAEFDWRKAELEALSSDSTKKPAYIARCIKSAQEAKKLGVEGIDMDEVMVLVLEKDPDYLNRQNEKRLSDAKRTAGHLGGNIESLDQKSAKAMLPELEALANQLKQQAGIDTSGETEVK